MWRWQTACAARRTTTVADEVAEGVERARHRDDSENGAGGGDVAGTSKAGDDGIGDDQRGGLGQPTRCEGLSEGHRKAKAGRLKEEASV